MTNAPKLDKAAQDLMDQYLDDSGQFKKEVPALATPATDQGPEQLPDEQEAETPEESQGTDRTIIDEFMGRARTGARTAGDRFNRAQDWIAQQPTPGGIAPLLFALIVFVTAIVPVSPQGYTRLQLLFYTIMGRTVLIGRRSPFPSGGGGSWSDPAPTPADPGLQSQAYKAPTRPTTPAGNGYVPDTNQYFDGGF